MKKVRKLLAAVSAVAVCAGSMSAFVSNAIEGGWIYAPDQTVTPYTTSFTVNGEEKYVLWQEASDYLYNMDVESEPFDDNGHLTCFRGSKTNVFISEKPFKSEILDKETGEVTGYKDCYGIYGYVTMYWGVGEDVTANSETGPLGFDDSYYLKNEEDKATMESYLSDNNIPYKIDGNSIEIQFCEKATIYDKMQVYIDIKENTGFVLNWYMPDSLIQITDVENVFPEKTLDGDANEDGEVNIADATAIVQAIGNPDKYALTAQGEFNADADGNGLSGADAIAIQMKLVEAGMPK